MFILDWFKGFFDTLGITNKSGKIIFLGLDNAGKTTLLGMLKDNKVKQFDPTLQPHSQELSIGNLRFKTWDLGGHLAARKTWRNYFPNVDGIIYMVDAAQQKRFQQSRVQLQSILNSASIANVPIVIFGNKIDKKGAVSQEKLRQALNITRGQSQRPIQLFMCSVAKRSGISQGFKWLGQYLK